MQIRGRSERKKIENSFTDIFVCKLLYPSNGGYMFPIKGLVMKKNYDNLYCIYLKEMINGREESNNRNFRFDLVHEVRKISFPQGEINWFDSNGYYYYNEQIQIKQNKSSII